MVRLYTEDVNREKVIAILDSLFAGYTLIPAIGRYKRRGERSLIVELVDADSDAVSAACDLIKSENLQESVLVVTVPDAVCTFA